jgi:hypothetical protein
VVACVAGLVFVGAAASQGKAGGTGCRASDRHAPVSVRAGAPVTVGLGGCMTVTNGHVRRTAGIQARGRTLVVALKRLSPLAIS